MHPFASTLLTHLRSRGFDLSAAFPVQSYNSAAPPSLRLPTYSFHTTTLGILVANTNILWHHFCTYIRAHPAHIRSTPAPLDAFVSLQVDECIALARAQAQVPESVEHDVRHYWELEPGRMVAIQRICQVAGVAYLDEGCHLNVHAEVGPWLALRSAIVIDLPGPDPRSIPQLSNPIPESLQPHIHHALLQLLPPGASYHTRPVPATPPPPFPPSRDHNGLTSDMLAALEAFQAAIADVTSEGNWKAWVALRRVAASWLAADKRSRAEYDALAIEYHYTKESHVLRTIIDSAHHSS